MPSPPPTSAPARVAPPASSARRRAVIDVGTNSVKLLVADLAGGAVEPILERSVQTRLGCGFYESSELQPDAIQQTAAAVAAFATEARTQKAASVRVIATSAARDARNGSALGEAIHTACGLRAVIISGAQEAAWTCRGVMSDARLANAPLLILDVGGGSSELILAHGPRRLVEKSFAIGTVRLLEQFRFADPPSAHDWQRCHDWLRNFWVKDACPEFDPALAALRPQAPIFVGTGGTTTLLARLDLATNDYDRARLDGHRLSRDQVRRQRERLWQLPLTERRNLIGLPPDRADVILTGAAIVETVMEQFLAEEVVSSMRGLRFGALLDEQPA